MGKGLGIAGLVILLVSFPIPVLGTWIGYLALVIAAVAALFGNKTWVIATTVVAVIKMYFLSPGLMATMYVAFAKIDGQSAPVEAYLPIMLTTFFAGLPIAMLIFRPAVMGLLRQIGIVKTVGG